MNLTEWMIRRYYNSVDATALKEKLDACLKSLYEEYCIGAMPSRGNSEDMQTVGVEQNFGVEQAIGVDGDPYGCLEFYLLDGGDTSENELSNYLVEKLERKMDINVLEWWRVNSSRYPILSQIARDVLAIPITTVASESAFSTSERVLDPYRASLTPTIIEALICTQDWFKGTYLSLITSEDYADLESIEQEVFHMEDVPS